MHTLTLCRLATLLLVVFAMLVGPATLGDAPGIAAGAAYQGEGNHHRDEGEADDNRGHGNEEDGFDEENPGHGNGRNAPGNAGTGDVPEVVVTRSYTIETECDFDDDDNRTECDISGDELDDGSDIGRITVPAESVCAEVIDGDFVYMAPDTGAIVTGYASEEGDDDLSIELHGRVTTSGTMTYWISTIDGVFPAEGPALHCDQPLTTTANPTSTAEPPSPTSVPTNTPEVMTGALTVATYTCTDVPADRSEYDWFGMCDPGIDTLAFALTPAGTGSGETQTRETDPTGEATFEALAPGTYQLDAVDASWCHATSDNVTTESHLVVDAGTTTTVWIFMCDENKGGV